jgi:hypothetical protein
MAEIKRLQGIFNTHGAYTQEELAAAKKAKADYEKLIDREYWSPELPEVREAHDTLISLLTERAAPGYFNLPQVEAMLNGIPLPESPKDLTSEHIAKVMDYFGGGIIPQVPLDSATFAALTTGTKEDGTSEPYSLNSPWCAMMNPKAQHPKDKERGLLAWNSGGCFTSDILVDMGQEMRTREALRVIHPAFTFIDNARKGYRERDGYASHTGGPDALLLALQNVAERANDTELIKFFSSRFERSWSEWNTNLVAISDIITREFHESGELPLTIRVVVTLASLVDAQMFFLQEAALSPTSEQKSTDSFFTEWTSTVTRRGLPLFFGWNIAGGLSYL